MDKKEYFAPEDCRRTFGRLGAHIRPDWPLEIRAGSAEAEDEVTGDLSFCKLSSLSV